MNQLDKSDERPPSTSQVVAPPSPIPESLSNEKILDSNIEKPSSFEKSLTTNYSYSQIKTNSTVPTTCSSEIVTSAQNILNSALSNTDKSAKIVVSNETADSSLLFKSELKTRPGTCVSRPNSSAKRPLVAYEEDEQSSDTPESASVPSVKPSTSEREESSVVKEEFSGTESSAPDAGALVEEQQPSTSTSGASTANSTSAQKPKTKRVRISIKLDQYSVLRLKRLAAENPKLLRKFGVKAYRINNFNGTNNKYQLVKVPRNQPKPIQPTLLKPGRRQSRTTSSTSSVTTPTPTFGTQSPTRFRQPYFPQRPLSNFEFVKGVAPPNYLMDQPRPQQQYQQQFSSNYPPQQRPQQLPQRYTAPAPQQQPIRQPMGQPEPGPSNVSDSPLLVGLLNNNPQTNQSGNTQQMRYPPPQQQQQMAPPQMMQTPGYPPQQQQQMGHPGQHMMQQQQLNPYAQFQAQRIPQQMVPNGAQPMQTMPNQPSQMIPNQGQIPPNMQQPPQQSEPMQKPAKAPRKRQTKKQKEEQAKKQEDQRKLQQMQMSNQHMAHVPQDYYMMQQQQRMPMPPTQMQRMSYAQYQQGYPQQQPSTSMMPGNYGGYPQQMWQQMPPPEYQMQMHQQMMRPPPNGQQTPGTPTSNYPVQSPSYPPQKMRMQTPQGYPQPSQYPMQHQQVMNRQFMSPPNHPSPSYGQAQVTPQFSYPQPQPPQMMQQQAQTPQSQQNQNPQSNMEEFAQFAEYGGSTFEDIGGLDDLGGEDCDLDSITPMNVEMTPTNPSGQQIHQHQMQNQQMQNQQMQNQQMQNQGHQMGMMPQQNLQQQYDSHQFAHPQMAHQQSPMGANQGYLASPGYQQQFQRPQSPQRYMQHVPQQMMQHQPQTSGNQGFSDVDVFQKAEEGSIIDELPKSPPKAPPQQQRNIEATVESVMAKDDTYFVKYFDDYKNKVDEAPPASASKRKSKSTNSRPPSRQPKNSQSSSAANTPTPGPIFGHSSASTEPSTPIKEELMDCKEFKTERKNSTLSTLLSGNSTPTIKSEENGIPDGSLAGISSPTVRSERDTTTTPLSTVSTPLSDVGIVKIENNNGSEQYSRFNGHTVHEASNPLNEAIALKTKQESPNNELTATADATDAALMPPPFKKMHKSDDVMEDKYFDGGHVSATS